MNERRLAKRVWGPIIRGKPQRTRCMTVADTFKKRTLKWDKDRGTENKRKKTVHQEDRK